MCHYHLLKKIKENLWFCAEVSVNEIEEALKSLASNKAPGLDGFPASFFKQYWPIVKDKIVALSVGLFQLLGDG